MTRRASSPIHPAKPEPVVTIEIDHGQPVAADDLVGAWLDVVLSAMERRQARATADVAGDHRDQHQAAAAPREGRP